MKNHLIAVLTVLVLSLSNSAQAEVITNGPWDGGDMWFGWDETIGYPTFGQTFEFDYERELNSFSFITNYRPVQFYAYIATWEGSGPGLVFFASPLMTLGSPFEGFREISVNTGNLELQGDRKYVAIFSSTSFDGSDFGPILAADLSGKSYEEGEFVYMDNWGSPDGPFTWPYNVTETDLIFKLNVTPIPEPETYAMMLSGLGLFGFMAKRKKKLSN